MFYNQDVSLRLSAFSCFEIFYFKGQGKENAEKCFAKLLCQYELILDMQRF